MSMSQELVNVANRLFDPSIETDTIMPSDPPHTDMLIRIFAFGKLCDIIQDIGWHEHTSDWDPYIEIQMKDGTTIQTMNGWFGVKIEFDESQHVLTLDAGNITHALFADCEKDDNEIPHYDADGKTIDKVIRVAVADIERLVLAS